MRDAAALLREASDAADGQAAALRAAQAADEALAAARGNKPQYMWLREEAEAVDAWRRDTVPEAERLDQAGHTVCEASEILDEYVKAAQYPGHELDDEHLMTEAGDVMVSLMSLMGMEGWDPVECVRLARGKNAREDWEAERGL